MKAVVGTLLSSVVPRGLTSEIKYTLERHGQDTRVRRVHDDEIVFETGVDATSAGSDTDKDLSGGEEYFKGCLWTLRQQMTFCDGGTCEGAEILAHDLQSRLWNLYTRGAPPPLEEAAWLTYGTTQEQRREIMDSCPGLMVTVLLLMAEVRVFSDVVGADAFAHEAQTYIALLEQQPDQIEMLFGMFPVAEAWNSFQRVRSNNAPVQPSVDIVIARCKASLQWLWEYIFPEDTRIYVYEKCGQVDARKQLAGLPHVESFIMNLGESNAHGFMTGECTAYLEHVITQTDLANFTIFMHDDGPRHIRVSLLGLVLQGMSSGAYQTPFFHLSHERYPAFHTPCHRDVYKRVFNEELSGLVSTYCCSHFVVSRERISAHSRGFYQRIATLVSEAPYVTSRGGQCNFGSKPCYVMEFLWHRVFGEEDELPRRAEQISLPLALRYEGGRATQLPSPLKVAPYMTMFQPHRYSDLLMASR